MRRKFRRTPMLLLTALVSPIVFSAILLPFRDWLLHADLCFMILIVGLSTLGNRTAGVVASLSSAFWNNFFFALPYESVNISSLHEIIEPILMLTAGIMVSQLAYNHQHVQLSEELDQSLLRRIRATVRLSQSSAAIESVIASVQKDLTIILGLRSCGFSYEMFPEQSPRLAEGGSIIIGSREWDVDEAGMPDDRIVLKVFAGGVCQGCYLMFPIPGSNAPIQARLTALTLADITGITLAAARPAWRRTRD